MVYTRIRDLREDHDLSQKAIAQVINISARSYGYYESGQRTIPPHILIALADYYHTSVDYLLGRTHKK